uniref:Uncharacterized protein LOC111136647 isoform X2 n=1 Tax=Crassostrea virginica TaxID=6565 RepID=A0A8B8ETW5_CRAVI|nr:uncharacterized protein LOC111136647 isoform X2 [Crassostrea virginica]
MSEPSDKQASAQYYLICGTEDCETDCQLYCRDCHRPLCEQCKDEHLKSPVTKNHEIVLYVPCKDQRRMEKRKRNPTQNSDIFRRNGKLPVCLNCFTKEDHQDERCDNIEEIYEEKYALWQSKISKIKTYFLPTSQGLKTDIENDATKIKKIMKSSRESMMAEAASLKETVDSVTSENIRYSKSLETFLHRMLKSQEATYDDYITYLEKMNYEFQKYLSSLDKKLLLSETLKIRTIPETMRPVPPVFIAGYFFKNVEKLLGRVGIPTKKPEKREIKPMEEISTHIKSAKKQLDQSTEKSNLERILSLFSSITKVREYVLPVHNASHVSVDKSGILWVNSSGCSGRLVSIDLEGNLLKRINTNSSCGNGSFFTVMQGVDLIYIDGDEIFRLEPHHKITEFIKTGDWQPLSLHSSRINGDILVGMVGMEKDGEAKVTRYTKTGKEIQNIQRDDQGQDLYHNPLYITENINGDICTSDPCKRAVVVVNKSGQHRFSYAGQGSGLFPWGICTDVLGNILVSDSNSNTVHLVDQNGEFLSFILSTQGIRTPFSLCVDDENNLYVGQIFSSIVTVYKYLK